MKRFEVGKEYGTNFVCSYDTWIYFTVVRRTEKSVWLKDRNGGEVKRRKIDYNFDGNEMCTPLGSYSMAPLLDANDKVE